MRAAIMDGPARMRIGAWDRPSIGSEDVLVAVRAVGICAGDMYIYQGKNPYAAYPCIAGHEICGVVAEAGSRMTDFKAGELVVVEPFLGCGKCYPCRIGRSNCCADLKIIGAHQAGGYAEFVVAPATHIHRVPPGLSAFDASFTEPVAIGMQSCRRGNVAAGELILILGAGPIGLAIIEVAKTIGAIPIVADVLPERLEFARELGAETMISDENLVQAVLERTNGEGAPVVMEATGNVKAMEMTVDLVAAGGRIVIVGLVKRGTMLSLPGLDFTRKEMTIVGSRASVNCFPESLALLASGKIKYPKVATGFDLWKAPEVFADLAANPAAVHKGVLVNED